MPSFTADQPDLLARLRADQAQRWERGDRVTVETYVEQYPELASNEEALVALVYSEIMLRIDSGETPSLDEYLSRFSQHAESLRRRWAAHDLIEQQAHADAPGSTIADRLTQPVSQGALRVRLPSLPGYEVLEQIGRGGMGVVFKARQAAFDRLVAIKRIRAADLAGPDELARFRTEALAVGRLDHPHIVRVHDFEEEQGEPFLVMEYLPGGSLEKLLDQGPLQARRAAELVRQVALGVQAAHDRGILHRDLKPANVLLTADGIPRITDFGLAKLLDADSGQTASETVMGTAAYMAPEQAAGKVHEINRPADVWSLGVILYECLTGKLPFEGTSRQETLQRVRTLDPVPPRRLRREVPADLEAICLKCLCKDPGERYASAQALAEDLAAWLEGRRPGACSAGVIQEWLRRHPRLLLAGLALVGAVLLAVGLGLGGRASLRDPDETPPAGAAGERATVLIAEKGMPRWHRYRLGGKLAGLGTNKKGFCTLTSDGVVLLDLARATGRDRYRIRAQVRHESSAGGGEVGLYLAATAHTSPGGTIHRAIVVSFNDVHNQTQRNKHLKFLKLPEGNTVTAGLQHRGDLLDGTAVRNNVLLCMSKPFQPSGSDARPGEWRSLQVIVSPQQIRFLWDQDLSVGTLSLAELDKRLRIGLLGLKRAFAQQPPVQGLPAGLDLRGAVGLYLYRGSASFCQVRIEPLAPEDGTK
jgi:serine/threonine-protein kinase